MGCCASQPPPKQTVKSTPQSEPKKSSIKSYATKTEKPTKDYQTNSNQSGATNTTNNAPKRTKIIITPPKEETENNTSNTSTEPPKSSEPKQSNESKTVEPQENIVSSFSGLYDIFTQHAMGDKSDKMDINGLTTALKIFGLKIDKDPELRKLIWSKFDLEKHNEIDYNDFMATMSSLIDVKNEDGLFLFFQIFDYDQNGFLEVDELAEMLYSQQKIAAAVTNQRGLITSTTNKQCMDTAQRFVNENDDNGDGKISFDEYNNWRQEHHITTPMKS